MNKELQTDVGLVFPLLERFRIVLRIISSACGNWKHNIYFGWVFCREFAEETQLRRRDFNPLADFQALFSFAKRSFSDDEDKHIDIN